MFETELIVSRCTSVSSINFVLGLLAFFIKDEFLLFKFKISFLLEENNFCGLLI